MIANVATGHSNQMIHDDHTNDSMEIAELEHHSEGKELGE